MPLLKLAEGAIHYRVVPGNAARATVVLLHEGLGSVGLWRDFPDRLAGVLGCRVLAYSRFGYGQSDRIVRPRTPRFMHEEALEVLPELLTTLGVDRPILVGHSDGASIALVHAAAHPQNVTALVLMAPHVFVEEITLRSIARVAERYETTDLKARLARHHANVDDAFLGWAETWLSPQFRTWSLVSEVSRLRTPTLLIQGADDDYGTLAQIDAIAEAAPVPVQRLVVERCGHSPHRDQPDQVLLAIDGFLQPFLK
jgi:pimeloyl-ACP methyl ester carboxylesterase